MLLIVSVCCCVVVVVIIVMFDFVNRCILPHACTPLCAILLVVGVAHKFADVPR